VNLSLVFPQTESLARPLICLVVGIAMYRGVYGVVSQQNADLFRNLFRVALIIAAVAFVNLRGKNHTVGYVLNWIALPTVAGPAALVVLKMALDSMKGQASSFRRNHNDRTERRNFEADNRRSRLKADRARKKQEREDSRQRKIDEARLSQEAAEKDEYSNHRQNLILQVRHLHTKLYADLPNRIQNKLEEFISFYLNDQFPVQRLQKNAKQLMKLFRELSTPIDPPEPQDNLESILIRFREKEESIANLPLSAEERELIQVQINGQKIRSIEDQV